MKRFLLILMLLTLIPTALATDLNVTIDITYTNESVTISHNSKVFNQTVPLNGSVDKSYIFTAVIPIALENQIQNDILGVQSNASFNKSELVVAFGQEVDRGIASQQAWITETYMPQVEIMQGLESDNSFLTQKNGLCEQSVTNLQYQLNAVNQTTSKYLETLERENKTFAYSLAGIMLVICLTLALIIYQKFRGGTPGGTFRR